jgi:SAM-dependent methyltransferase
VAGAQAEVIRDPTRDTPGLETGTTSELLGSDGREAGIDWSLLTLLLSHEKSAPVAAVGADVPAISQALAKSCASVIGVGRCREGILRAEPQRAWEGARNVFAVCADTTGGLPFRDRSLGLIIANQLVKTLHGWGAREATEVRAGFFLEARRVLKAGGTLCLLVDRKRSGLSPSKMRALLGRCGFPRSESYMAYPGCHRLDPLAPIGSAKAMLSCIDFSVEGNAFRERRRRVWLKFLAATMLLPYVAPEYIILAGKEG